jgi:hypothetical protein
MLEHIRLTKKNESVETRIESGADEGLSMASRLKRSNAKGVGQREVGYEGALPHRTHVNSPIPSSISPLPKKQSERISRASTKLGLASSTVVACATQLS